MRGDLSKEEAEALENNHSKELDQLEQDHTRTIITQDGWKLCLHTIDKLQLFNLQEDPGEINNLFYSGKHDDVIDSLKLEIHTWQEKTQDLYRV
jgi:hypothetical protein